MEWNWGHHSSQTNPRTKSTTSEVNKKIEGDTPRHDDNKPAGDDIPDSAAAEKANQKRKGKQAAAADHFRIPTDTDPKAKAIIEAMRKEGLLQEFKTEEGCKMIKVKDKNAAAYRTLYIEAEEGM
nr:hypothetical protein [Tanacetum cinerariifolium]